MKKLKRILGLTLSLSVAAILLLVLFSPYRSHEGFDYPLIHASIEIDVPASQVFSYLGVSANASKWSVFVDHITPLNTDSVPDGSVGCIRRCFKEEDETGIQWDETITVVEPNQRRQLTIFNMKNFPMTAKNLATEQLYTPLGEEKCRLALTVFFTDHNPDAWDWFKTKLAAWRIKSIFIQNLQNIKTQVETDGKQAG